MGSYDSRRYQLRSHQHYLTLAKLKGKVPVLKRKQEHNHHLLFYLQVNVFLCTLSAWSKWGIHERGDLPE